MHLVAPHLSLNIYGMPEAISCTLYSQSQSLAQRYLRLGIVWWQVLSNIIRKMVNCNMLTSVRLGNSGLGHNRNMEVRSCNTRTTKFGYVIWGLLDEDRICWMSDS